RSEWASFEAQQAQAQAQAQPQAPAAVQSGAAPSQQALQYQAAAQAVHRGVLPSAAGANAGLADSNFVALDINHDGILGRDEISVQPALSERFAEFDLNGDGVLSASEYAMLRNESARQASQRR